jgi:hypothetical protein
MAMLLLLPFLSYSCYVRTGEEGVDVGKGEGEGKNNIIKKELENGKGLYTHFFWLNGSALDSERDSEKDSLGTESGEDSGPDGDNGPKLIKRPYCKLTKHNWEHCITVQYVLKGVLYRRSCLECDVKFQYPGCEVSIPHSTWCCQMDSSSTTEVGYVKHKLRGILYPL